MRLDYSFKFLMAIHMEFPQCLQLSKEFHENVLQISDDMSMIVASDLANWSYLNCKVLHGLTIHFPAMDKHSDNMRFGAMTTGADSW